jgi:RimJ/RimL family protein N-acetyltransferase
LEPLSLEIHASNLFDAYSLDAGDGMWTYLPSGPFESRADFDGCVKRMCAMDDPQFYAIIDAQLNKATGIASLLRITPAHGSIEVGFLAFSPLLQRTTAATEAMYLMMRRSFELGYRRYEWKCDSLNTPSRAAAKRLGFTFEGIFRQAVVYKGRNRDTAWFSILDTEWPKLKVEFERWLDPSNFDADGRQLTKLRAREDARHT